MSLVAEDFPQPFEVRAGAEQRVPFVFNSPHSGQTYPSRFLDMSRLDRHVIRRSEDSWVDQLFAAAVPLGAPMLVANFPRAYLDVNREAWELDPRMFSGPVPAFVNKRSARVAGGLGSVPRIVGTGLDIYPGKLPIEEALDRIETIYIPYHQCLKQLVDSTHARFGTVVLIDCHSMPGGIRVGDSGMRPDFIVGDRFGTSASAALTEQAIGLLTAMGYAVAHNRPYAGGYITEHYGRPALGRHALQIEVNRSLYMDEQSLCKAPGFDALASDLSCFISGMMAESGQYSRQQSLAAE